MTEIRIRVEYEALGDMMRWPRNPKEHALSEIDRSISRFGFITPILVDDRTGRIVAGHGRLDVLEQMKERGEAPPQRVLATADGEWLVPVIRGVTFNSDGEAEAYLIADNQLTVAGGWNEPELARVLADLQAQGEMMLAGTGYDAAAVESLVKRALSTPEGEFPEYDESVASDVDLITCPNCGTQIPK